MQYVLKEIPNELYERDNIFIFIYNITVNVGTLQLILLNITINKKLVLPLFGIY